MPSPKEQRQGAEMQIEAGTKEGTAYHKFVVGQFEEQFMQLMSLHPSATRDEIVARVWSLHGLAKLMGKERTLRTYARQTAMGMIDARQGKNE